MILYDLTNIKHGNHINVQVASHATNGSKYGPWSTVESARTGTGISINTLNNVL